MFTHIVILKKSPWFLYADNEKDALSIYSKFKEDAAGIVLGKELIVKHPRQIMTLEQEETKMVELKEPLKNDKDEEVETINSMDDEQLEVDILNASKELEDEFNKLQSSID